MRLSLHALICRLSGDFQSVGSASFILKIFVSIACAVFGRTILNIINLRRKKKQLSITWMAVHLSDFTLPLRKKQRCYQ